MKLNTTLIKEMKNLGLSESPDAILRQSVALFLFQKRLVSIGKAAELAAMALSGFMDLLQSLKIPQTEYTQDDFDMDASTIKRLKRERHAS